jgi:hypothetical protein
MNKCRKREKNEKIKNDTGPHRIILFGSYIYVR